MREKLNLTESARLLGVTKRTLTTWLKQGGITAAQLQDDKRQFTLTMRQLEALAKKHNRSLADHDVESISSNLRELDQRVGRIEKHLGLKDEPDNDLPI